ncbi:MAG: hypothetical protein IPF71_16240 [Rhodoferax sp.]|nr:hypothetical protein [Rhodoferax sp.]
MSCLSNSVVKSYVKTTVVCLVLVPVALLVDFWACIGSALPVTSTWLVTFGVVTFVCASAVVLVRYKRGARGEQDLFLELNRSRDPAAVKSAPAARISRARRWLAGRLLGHDLVVGDMVEIKTWAEIRATLDERGCLEQLPFMPEMLAMCGQRAYVFRCMHRLFDFRKIRRMRHMDGAVLLVGVVRWCITRRL